MARQPRRAGLPLLPLLPLLSLLGLAPWTALQGVGAATNVTVGVAHSPPWVYVDNRTILTDATACGGAGVCVGDAATPALYGVLIDLLAEVAREAAVPCTDSVDLTCGLRFQYRVYPSTGSASPPTLPSTDGVGAPASSAVEALLAGEVQLLPSLPVLPGWADAGVAFTAPWTESSLAFVTVASIKPRGLLYMFSPLDPTTWLVVVAAFGVAGLTVVAMDRWPGASYGPCTALARCRRGGGSAEEGHAPVPEALEGHGSRGMGIRDGMFHASLALIGLAATPPPSHAQRLVHLAMFVLFFFVMRAYLARLTAIVAVPAYDVQAADWSSLVSSHSAVGVVGGSAAAAWLHDSTNPTILAVRPRLQVYNDLGTALADVRSHALAALVTESTTAQYLALQPPCEDGQNMVPVVDTSVDLGLVAMAYLSNGTLPSSAVATLSASLVHAALYGTLAGLASEYLYAPGNCASLDSVRIDAKPIQPSDLGGIFILFYTLVVVAVAFAMFERRAATRLNSLCDRVFACCVQGKRWRRGSGSSGGSGMTPTGGGTPSSSGGGGVALPDDSDTSSDSDHDDGEAAAGGSPATASTVTPTSAGGAVDASWLGGRSSSTRLLVHNPVATAVSVTELPRLPPAATASVTRLPSGGVTSAPPPGDLPLPPASLPPPPAPLPPPPAML